VPRLTKRLGHMMNIAPDPGTSGRIFPAMKHHFQEFLALLVLMGCGSADLLAHFPGTEARLCMPSEKP